MGIGWDFETYWLSGFSLQRTESPVAALEILLWDLGFSEVLFFLGVLGADLRTTCVTEVALRQNRMPAGFPYSGFWELDSSCQAGPCAQGTSDDFTSYLCSVPGGKGQLSFHPSPCLSGGGDPGREQCEKWMNEL